MKHTKNTIFFQIGYFSKWNWRITRMKQLKIDCWIFVKNESLSTWYSSHHLGFVSPHCSRSTHCDSRNTLQSIDYFKNLSWTQISTLSYKNAYIFFSEKIKINYHHTIFSSNERWAIAITWSTSSVVPMSW